jgi:16S rRNA processing protein RimM
VTGADRPIRVGRVGRPHGRDGSFYVEDPSHPFHEGVVVTLGGRQARVERRAGTAERPLVRLSGITGRTDAAALRGEPLLVSESEAPLADGEWLVDDLLRCTVRGLGRVRGVLAGPSCDLLEVGEERHLVPLVSDAIRQVDIDARSIEVDRGFLGMDEGAARAKPSPRRPSSERTA